MKRMNSAAVVRPNPPVGMISGLVLGFSLLLLDPVHQDILRFRPGDVSLFRLWEWWSGHWVHWSLNHAIWDLIAWGILAFWLEKRLGAKALWKGVFILSPVISLGIVVMYPEITTYAGLSALACALFSWALTEKWIRREGRGEVVIWAALFAVKAGLDAIHGPAGLFAGELGSGAVSLAGSHLIGAAAGLGYGSMTSRPWLRNFRAAHKLSRKRTTDCPPIHGGRGRPWCRFSRLKSAATSGDEAGATCSVIAGKRRDAASTWVPAPKSQL